MSAIAIGSRALRPARLSVIRGTRGHAAAVEPPSAPFLPPSPSTASTQEGLSAAQASLRNVPARPSATARDGEVRRDWTRGEIQAIYDGGLMETIFRAVSHAESRLGISSSHPSFGTRIGRLSQIAAPDLTDCSSQASVHRMHHDPSRIQLCTLMNIKSLSLQLG